jgi:hypothetical protein
MFDSPMEHCPVCGQMVVLDQAMGECGRKQGCAADTVCPLQKYFTGTEAELEKPKNDLLIP